MSIFTKEPEGPVDYAAETEKIRASNTRDTAKLQQIVTSDNEYQNEVANRGGTMMSSLTDKANEAAQRVLRAGDEERAALARSVVKRSAPAHAALITDAREKADAYLAAYNKLGASEYALNQYLAVAGQPQQPMASGGSVHPVEFIQRAERVMHPPTPARAVARPPLAQPDFSQFIAG